MEHVVGLVVVNAMVHAGRADRYSRRPKQKAECRVVFSYLLTKGPHTKCLLTDSHTTNCLPTVAGYYIPSQIDFIWSHKVSYNLKWSLSGFSPPIFAKLSQS